MDIFGHDREKREGKLFDFIESLLRQNEKLIHCHCNGDKKRASSLGAVYYTVTSLTISYTAVNLQGAPAV